MGGVPDEDGRSDLTVPVQLALDYGQELLPSDDQQHPLAGGQAQAITGEPGRVLSAEQEQAIASRHGSLLLAAGAGSGKTSVLVERFVRAVCEDGIAPGRILAITFTERAAGELRERVRRRLLQLGKRDAARDAEAANVSTFHGFCARLLRIHPLQAGVEPGFQILEEGFAERLRVRAFSDALAGFLEGERTHTVDLVAAYGADPLRAMVLGAYAQLRSQGHAEPRLPSGGEGAEEEALLACALIGELLERFGAAYAKRKQLRTALDFDDLELSARSLLQRRADVREAWAARFELLMVDEFQDSSPRQLQVLATLDRDNLFTVGDELQSIYAFRHADVSLFRERRAQLGERGRSLALTRNFRSAPAILTAVERIFAPRMGEYFTALTPSRPVPREQEPIVELLLTDKRGWERFPTDEELEGMPEATPWRQAEARQLADRVAELISAGEARAGEVAILLRALGDLPVYESALRHRGLSTLAGVGGFWSHQQVRDLLAWLRALANPLDELALYSVLASPLVGVSSDGLALLAGFAHERKRGVWQVLDECETELEAILPTADRARLAAFRELFAAERSAAALHPISELLRRAIASTGYDRHVLSLNWGERRFANVNKLVRLARRFEAQEGRDLRGFVDHVAHIEAALGREADAPVGDGELDSVRLMSMHAAKGLEFPVVCVADLGRELNLRSPDLIVDAGGRVGLRLLELRAPEPRAVLDYEQLREERRRAQEEEEDRVLYVACTRAEKRLLLSGSVAFERWPAPKPGVAPIAWLAPALVPDAPKLALSEEHSPGALTIDVGGGLRVQCTFNGISRVVRESVDPSGSDESPGTLPSAAIAPQSGPGAVQAEGSFAMPPSAWMPSTGSSVVQTGRGMPGPLSDPGATMSYTSLAELERCGYRYYLERSLRLSENHAAARREGGGGIDARARGTIVHALLEDIDLARPQPPSSEEVALVARRIGVRVDTGEREEIVELICAALAAEPARRLAKSGAARREHPFAFSLGSEEPLVTGVLDLIVQQADGSSLIVDYKSDRVGAEEDLEALVQRDYGLQRLLYALAAIEDGVDRVEVAHWFLERPEELVVARFASSERPHLRKRLLERIERVRSRGFAVTADPHRGICLTCPGRGGLCSWGETRTMSERSATLESDRQGDRLI
jgi:ATP-dependent helicase/nuclease subunit A